MQTTKVAAVVALALLAAMLAVGVAWAAPDDTDPTFGASAELRKAVEPAGILVHERRFQRIANANEDSGSRARWLPLASAGYVAGKLVTAGYDVSVQRFEFPYLTCSASRFSQTASSSRTFEPTTSLRTQATTPSWSTRAAARSRMWRLCRQKTSRSRPVRRLTRLTAAAGRGLRARFETKDQVALIQRGTCTLPRRPRTPKPPATTRRSSSTRGQEGAHRRRVWHAGRAGHRHPGDRHTLRAGPAALPEGRARVSLDIQTKSRSARRPHHRRH